MKINNIYIEYKMKIIYNIDKDKALLKTNEKEMMNERGNDMNKEPLRIFERQLETLKNNLTKSDLKIVELLKNDPEVFTSLSITEISQRTNTSTASVTRLVRKFGYDKLTDFKLAVTRDMQKSVSSEYANVDKNDDVNTIANKVLIQNTESIKDLSRMLKPDDIEKALKILKDSNRIIFAGLGGSASVAQDAYHKFIRLGLIAELVTDVHMQIVISSVGSDKDVIVVISNEGANTEMNQALKIGKQNGMKIIAITQVLKSPLTRIADISLFTLPRKLNYKPESLISRVQEYSLIDVLYVAYVMKSGKALDDNLMSISENMKKFKSYDE